MLNRRQEVLLPHLCRLIGPASGGELSDRALLERFLGEHDAAAFEALVRRHGPTVLGVCRRVLHNAHDAEDAFQATFLVLVRKGRSIVRREAVGSFLYGVAYRVALKARAGALRRRHHENQAALRTEGQTGPEESNDLRPVLDEELNRLPDKYRRPIVLCYFEGKTYQEAARLLGWPAGTAATRLARARELLRARLARRGLALSAVVLAAWLAEGAAPAADVCLLAGTTARAALDFVTGPAAAGVSTQVIALTEGVVKAMFRSKMRMTVGILLVAGMACAATGALWHLTGTGPAAAADPPGATRTDDSRTPGGEVLVAAGRPAGEGGTSLLSHDEPPAQEPEAPAGSPPRALAPPVGGAARPLRSRIGLINLTRAFKGSKKYQALQADLRAQSRQLGQKLEVLKKQWQALQEEAAVPTTPADRRERLGGQLLQLQREVEDESASAKKKITRLEGDALTRMYREIEEVARRIAQRDDLELVLFYNDTSTEADYYSPSNLQRKLSQPGLVPMIVSPGMDITEKVVEALNQMDRSSGGPRR
jgi:RNA polymerase sigma factor (sigma-70 family)